jgi:hypothetical protein
MGSDSLNRVSFRIDFFALSGDTKPALLDKVSVPFESGAASESLQMGTPLRSKAGRAWQSDSFARFFVDGQRTFSTTAPSKLRRVMSGAYWLTIPYWSFAFSMPRNGPFKGHGAAVALQMLIPFLLGDGTRYPTMQGFRSSGSSLFRIDFLIFPAILNLRSWTRCLCRLSLGLLPNSYRWELL